MDRARAAGYIDNNFVQNQQRLRKRRDHLERIAKIKNRKPGSSVTLDNSAPELLSISAEQSRKNAKQGLHNIIIERENKVLLQRISSILMEPPRDTVKEYLAMKKLVVPKMQGQARLYDRTMQRVRNQKFFDSLRNQKPVYKVSEWERDYQVQKYQQRFMREVTYARPSGFCDPFSAEAIKGRQAEEAARYDLRRHAAGDESKDGSPDERGSPDRSNSSAAHVDRLRAMRSGGRHSNAGVPRQQQSASHQHGKSSPTRLLRKSMAGSSASSLQSGSSDGFERSGSKYDVKVIVGEGDDFLHGDDEYGFGDDEDDSEEWKELLAESRREIRVSEEQPLSAQHRHRQQASGAANNSSLGANFSVYNALAEIKCWLVNNEVVVLSAVLVNEDSSHLQAEAEISAEDLAVLRGEEPSLFTAERPPGSADPADGDQSEDPQQGLGEELPAPTLGLGMLRQIGAEMVAHVEMRVDLETGARLILNLVSEQDQQQLDDEAGGFGASTASGADFGGPGMGGSGGDGKGRGASGEWAHSLASKEGSLLSEEELGDMLIDDGKTSLLTMGVKVPVHFENQVITQSIANLGNLIDATKIKSRRDHVFALFRAYSTEDDQMAVTVNVVTSTTTQFTRGTRPAVVKGSCMKLSTSLPSVIHADPELKVTFAQNLAAHMSILHSSRTGKNVLTIENLETLV